MGLLDAISPTPRNRILGLLADATHGVNDFASKPFGYDNPPARMLMGLLGVPSIATTLDRLSYGEPLTNIGKANVPLLKPETADAAMAAAAALPAVSRGALKASDAAVRAITRNPQATATKVMDYAAQMNPANPMVVWHGSPHKFDKFDSSKIGTGEGAQAYGHGLYLAEKQGVAQSYADALGTPSANQVFFNGKPVATIEADALKSPNQSVVNNAIVRAVSSLKDAGVSDDVARRLVSIANQTQASNVADAIARLELVGKYSMDGGKSAKSSIDFLNGLSGQGIEFGWRPPNNYLYKVDLPDSAIAKMLDWDKPLSQQHPDTQLALEALRESARKSFPAIADGDPTGMGIYSAYQGHRGGNQAAASEKLRELGIPGIRYLDGGSRGAGAGTSNFVVFPGNEGLLSILERNGVPLK